MTTQSSPQTIPNFFAPDAIAKEEMAQITFRIPISLRDKFAAQCDANSVAQSVVMRRLLESIV